MKYVAAMFIMLIGLSLIFTALFEERLRIDLNPFAELILIICGAVVLVAGIEMAEKS